MNDRILVVEDDLEIARIIKDTLEQQGYFVTWATTGLEGWEDFQNAECDLVLVDWMLPEMDGITLCKNIRWKSEVPIIMISARNEVADKVEGLQGADDYLAKPFSLEELKARVASHLRRWRSYHGRDTAEEHKVQFEHGLSVDWQTAQIFLRNNEIALTNKEFELFKLLTQNPLRTFSKSELYQHIWQQNDCDDTHTVTVHIKALREKLQDPVKTPYFIQTVWGKGYRFIGERP